MNYDEVYISFKLSKKANQLLSESAKNSGRSKKVEAKLRLESNLKDVESVTTIERYNLRS